MRIITGKHRGRKLETPKGSAIRPTSDRSRESIFNLLEHVYRDDDDRHAVREQRVMDVFCGTGALGLEALSRGAEHVVFLDHNREALALARRNVDHLGEMEHATFIRCDIKNLRAAQEPCSLVLLDPPYEKRLILPALRRLTDKGWLIPKGLALVEMGEKEAFDIPAGFMSLKDRVYGLARVVLMRWEGES